MHPQERAFMQAIIETPEDDAPRLIAADWLEEYGQAARAEFVRLQVELAVLRPGPVEHRKASSLLRRYYKGAPVNMRGRTPASKLMREQVLLDTHWSLWLHDTFDTISPDVGCSTRGVGVGFGVSLYDEWHGERGHFDCSFRRGFVAKITLPTADFLAHAGALGAACPLERVTLSDREPDVTGNLNHFWERGNRLTEERGDIPGAIFDRMWPRQSYDHALFRTRDLAIDALSAACVSLARAEARKLREVSP